MANFAYTTFKRGLMAAEFDLDATDDIRAMLVMTGTVADTTEDALTLGDIVPLDEYDGANYTAGGELLASMTVLADNANNRGEFDAADVVYSALGAGTAQAQAIVLYKFITSTALSVPIAFIDTGGFPFAGNGGDVTVQWNAEAIVQTT